MENNQGRFWALLPLLTFIVVYLGTSLVLHDFYKMPILVAFLFSAIVGFIQYSENSFNQKIEEFSKGAGDSGIMLMILIFLLAGAFAEVSKSIGAVQSTINFALSYVSPSLLLGGLFLTACFISLSLGTSVGTVVALAPIAAGINESIPGTLAVVWRQSFDDLRYYHCSHTHTRRGYACQVQSKLLDCLAGCCNYFFVVFFHSAFARSGASCILQLFSY
jgi:hypothetical protein